MNWFISDFNIRARRLIGSYDIKKAPGVTLIYGPNGVGKSAMLRQLDQRIGLKSGGIFTDSLSFARQYAYAAQENQLNVFRQRYRTARLLLIDDLQFLTGKVKTIEELHYTYEYVIENGGKMVITLEADQPQIEFLGERLASRFLSGMVVSIDQPQRKEIERFLYEYCHLKRLFIDQMVLEIIAERIDNLADAIKVIEQFVQFAELQQDELSLLCFQTYWEHEKNRKKSVADPLNIIHVSALTMEVSVEELLGPSRKPRVNEARQLTIYTMRTLCQISFPAIASYFNRKHSTIIASYQKMQKKMLINEDLNKKYLIILKTFKA
ncbi:DnaA/Hda family protein [Desulfosporosinus sp. Sb-LF]|uniref:DnaA/Hda family protein n=1 Tax=Desulfosporosinus sp. Sb-LF TaxID=2560027 RepID=UPI00107F093E|nr:DnaA/Hda family protein [Desulfosporosinus sp. Sb-LF]TGE32373.1 chromosomal replication initiator DnaA [Desulfosporosinus sp. Sb-LF]